VSGQVQPDGLADVVGVGVAQLVPAADGPDRRGVPFDECIPCLPVPAAGAYPQVGDRWVITRRVGIFSGRCAGARGCGACCVMVVVSGGRAVAAGTGPGAGCAVWPEELAWGVDLEHACGVHSASRSL
jgi:hypothetical protein